MAEVQAHAGRSIKVCSKKKIGFVPLYFCSGESDSPSLAQRFEAFHRPHSDDWVVRLKSPQPSDDGEYQCQVSTTPHRTAKIFLTVQGESS